MPYREEWDSKESMMSVRLNDDNDNLHCSIIIHI